MSHVDKTAPHMARFRAKQRNASKRPQLPGALGPLIHQESDNGDEAYLNLTVTALRTLEKKEAVRSAEGVVRDRERGRAKASEQVGVATPRVV